MEQNCFEIVDIKPGHFLFSSFKTNDGKIIFSIEESEVEHKPGIISTDEIENEKVAPVFAMVVPNSSIAKAMANYLIMVSEYMEKEELERTQNKENMTVKEYNETYGGNHND